MKFTCYRKESWEEKKQRLSTRHLWFAWFPVRLTYSKCCWLEWVWRTGTYHRAVYDPGWTWEYEIK